MSCTIKGKSLVLSWGRTLRLDSDVRVRAHVMSENVSVCVRGGVRELYLVGCQSTHIYRLGLNLCILFIMGSITDIRSVLTQRALSIFCETYHIPDEVHPQLPNPNQTIHEMPSGKICVYTSKGVPKDPFPKSFEFNAEHFATLVALPASFHKYLEPFLCLVGISRYYTLDEDDYPEFLGDNDEGMDLLAFIQTADPTKVRFAERQRAEDEPRLLESTVGRVVPLLLIAPTCASSELEASADRLFDEGASGDEGDADRKRKTVVADAGGPSHPPKKLREYYRTLGGASTTGKPMFVVQSMFTGDMLDAEARGEPTPTLPFVTSTMSATPEREDRSPADSVHGLNLRTIGAPQRSSAPVIATVTTVTAVIDTDATTTRAPVAPSLFVVGSSSTGRTDSVPDGFSDVCGSDYLIGGIRTPHLSRDVGRICPPKFFASSRGMDHDQLFTEFNVRAAQQISLNAEVRMRAEYNIREKRKLRAIVDEQGELLKAKDGEIESLKAQLLLKEAEAAEAIRLRADVFKFESAEQSLQSEEVADLDDQVTVVKLQNDNLVGQVHELESSFAGLQEKIAAYEGFLSQLEKFQDEKLEEVNEKFNKLCADFVEMALHLEEKFYPHILTTILGRWWLLTHGMRLAVAKQLADVAAYNPSAEADYLSALHRLQNVNFSLIAELKSNKDASVDTIMNLLRLDDILAERLGLTESQHLVDQLMVHIHHSPDQRIVGASALSFSLEVSNSRVKKMRENIANHVSDLRGAFVPLSEPLSDVALEGIEGTYGSTHDAAATLSTTFVFASTTPPISTDDYEVAHADGQGGASVGDETAAFDDMNLFVSNAELNISE
nr:hypothetical protein [Tanacetum cinerariifolium]